MLESLAVFLHNAETRGFLSKLLSQFFVDKAGATFLSHDYCNGMAKLELLGNYLLTSTYYLKFRSVRVGTYLLTVNRCSIVNRHRIKDNKAEWYKFKHLFLIIYSEMGMNDLP